MKDSYYTGYTLNLDKRLKKHNSGSVSSTKKANDWRIVYTEEIESKSVALKRERQIKNWKSCKMIQKLISQKSGSSPRS